MKQTSSTEDRKDVYQTVTDRLITELEKGTVPWQHFARNRSRSKGPRNVVSNKAYRGINTVILWCAPYESDYWLSFQQAQELGGHVKKGEKGWPCVFWKDFEIEDKESGGKKTIPVARLYHVFNLEQTDGVKIPKGRVTEALEPRSIEEANQACEEILANMPNKPETVIDSIAQAYYNSARDMVHMTERSQCVSDSRYYSTFFHELIHSTGHKSRLNRFEEEKNDHAFGSGTYSKEELVAEIGASMLCAKCDLFEDVAANNASYINSWLGKLKSDKKLIFWAAARAQKAADYITGEGN